VVFRIVPQSLGASELELGRAERNLENLRPSCYSILFKPFFPEDLLAYRRVRTQERETFVGEEGFWPLLLPFLYNFTYIVHSKRCSEHQNKQDINSLGETVRAGGKKPSANITLCTKAPVEILCQKTHNFGPCYASAKNCSSYSLATPFTWCMNCQSKIYNKSLVEKLQGLFNDFYLSLSWLFFHAKTSEPEQLERRIQRGCLHSFLSRKISRGGDHDLEVT
jgi:hypothetical protein